MSSKLIILRGNSGSGKSTISKLLQNKMGAGTMLIPQDQVRREILKVSDKKGNFSIELIKEMVLFGKNNNLNVIIEGILANQKYGNMLHSLINKFENYFVYYFDISFEETLRRHGTKSNSHEFGEKEMKEWWIEKDYLGIKHENLISENMSEHQVLNKILKDIGLI